MAIITHQTADKENAGGVPRTHVNALVSGSSKEKEVERRWRKGTERPGLDFYS